MKLSDLQVNGQVHLSKYPTQLETHLSDKALKKKLKKERRALGEMQNTLYAHGKYSV